MLPLSLATTLTLSPTLLGWQASARHLVFPAANVSLTHQRGPVAVGAELVGGLQTEDGQDLYRYGGPRLRVAALGGWSSGDGLMTVHLLAGPALAARLGQVQVGDHTVSGLELLPGVRAKAQIQGNLGDHLVWTWQSGGVARVGGLDWDAGLGLGVRW